MINFYFAEEKVCIWMQHKGIGYEYLSGLPNRTKYSGKATGIGRLHFVTSLNITRKLCYTVQMNL